MPRIADPALLALPLAVLVAGLLASLVGAPGAIVALLCAAVSAIVLLPRRLARPVAPTPASPAPLPVEPAADTSRRLAELRHDLRGILSPAMLSADRLTTSQDPAIRRAGELLIKAVEQADARITAERDVP